MKIPNFLQKVAVFYVFMAGKFLNLLPAFACRDWSGTISRLRPEKKFPNSQISPNRIFPWSSPNIAISILIYTELP